MNQPIDIVIDWLKVSGTSLYALVADGSGVRIGRLRAPEGWKNNSKALVVTSDGFNSHASAEIHRAVYTIKCYGATDDVQDAETVARAVYDRLHNAAGNTEDGGIVTSFHVTSTSTIEPDTDWPVVIARYEITTS